MAEPFLAEIRIMSFNFAPKGWALCDGDLLPINQNQALFALLGITFGGNGQTNFALPNMKGRTPIHAGSGHQLGTTGGEQAHTLTISELPTHTHVLNVTNNNGATNSPNGAYLGAFSGGYTAPAQLTTMNPGTTTSIGGSQAHPNMQPYLPLAFCIALQGIFPTIN